MAPREKKKPKRTVSPPQLATPKKRAVPSISVDTLEDEAVSWRVGMLDLGGSWGWGTLEPKHIVTVLKKLRDFESMTWGELTGGTSGNKPIPVDHLCAAAKKRLETKKLDDLDHLWELRLGGKLRIWGIRWRGCFHVLWWDPEHTVCPSHLRNT